MRLAGLCNNYTMHLFRSSEVFVIIMQCVFIYLLGMSRKISVVKYICRSGEIRGICFAAAAVACKPDTQPSAPHHTDNLKTKAPNTTGSNHLYNTLELLMMGIMCPKHVEQAIRSAINSICCIQLAFHFHILTTMHRHNHFRFLHPLLVPFHHSPL